MCHADRLMKDLELIWLTHERRRREVAVSKEGQDWGILKEEDKTHAKVRHAYTRAWEELELECRL
jgi:hypothetical protein